MASERTLIATMRPRRVSRARYTVPMPPAPTGATISYGPSRVPAVIGMLARLSLPYACLQLFEPVEHDNHTHRRRRGRRIGRRVLDHQESTAVGRYVVAAKIEAEGREPRVIPRAQDSDRVSCDKGRSRR